VNAVTQGGHELDEQEVRPRVDLVLWLGLDVLDRAGLDHGEQALGVPAGAGGRRGPWGRTARYRRATGCATPAASPLAAPLGLGGLGALQEVRRDRLSPAGAAAPRRGLGGSGRPRSALSRAAWLASGGVRGSSVMGVPPYSGPEMPPSLRTRQKWMAMKMTITNGKNQDVEHVPSQAGCRSRSRRRRAARTAPGPNTGV
jgi:hypothetical protein